jgi:hypothetical protein
MASILKDIYKIIDREVVEQGSETWIYTSYVGEPTQSMRRIWASWLWVNVVKHPISTAKYIRKDLRYARPKNLTCKGCPERNTCYWTDDPYNTNGDCLADK